MSTAAVVVPEEVPGVQPVVEDRGDVFEPEAESSGVRVDAEFNPAILGKLTAEEPAAKVDPPEEKPDAVIPRARFNEVNEENKALKARLDALQAAQQQPAAEQQAQQPAIEDPREKIREMRRQQKDLEVEGDFEAANAIGDQIDDLMLQTATVQAESRLKQATNQETLQSSLATVAEAAYTKYPFLDVDSDAVDLDAVGAVRARTTELINTGKTPVEALQIAVDEKGAKFAKLLGLTTTLITPGTSKADEVRQSRDIQARTTAASASVAQPPVLPGKGEESFVVNVDKMTDAQFKQFKNTEAAAKARGDIF